MKVAVLRETRPDEDRVAAVPDTVRDLVDKHGLEVAVEAGAGSTAHFLDDEYRDAGATLGDRESVLSGAQVVLKVQAPTADGPDPETGRLPSGSVLISFLSPYTNLDVVQALADGGVTSFAMELIPRTTRAQKMDALSSQATVAGYKAVLLGADALGKLLPMLMTAAGTIRPGKVLVLGAGVAGLQAIATARRLGARVEAFDVRPAVKEQVESLGATFLETEEDVTAEGEGGYAKELSEEQHEKELQLIADHIDTTDIVITTAQIPGRDAPLLITEEMLRSMKPGSVVVDLATESGGNCAMSKMGETVEAHGVVILGPVNLPSAIPVHSSQMYAKNVATFLKELIGEEGELVLDFDDDIQAGCCVTHEGRVRHEGTRERLGGSADGASGSDGEHQSHDNSAPSERRADHD